MRTDPLSRGAGAVVVRAQLYCGHCREFFRGGAFSALKRAHKHIEKTDHVVYGSLKGTDGIIEQTRIAKSGGVVVPDATGFSYGSSGGV